MEHTNASYDHDSKSISPDDLPSNRQNTLSPGGIRRTSDQLTVAQNLNSDNPPPTMIDKKYAIEVSPEQKVPNMENKHENSSDDNTYYSLKRFRESRRGERDED